MDSSAFAKLILEQANHANISANFSEEEKTRLVTLFNGNDLNQFYFLIVDKVLLTKSFTVPNEKVIPFLMQILADMPDQAESLQIKDEKDILDTANSLFKILSVIDINSVGNTAL